MSSLTKKMNRGSGPYGGGESFRFKQKEMIYLIQKVVKGNLKRI